MREPGDVTEVGTIVEEKVAFDHPFFPVVSRVIETPDGVRRDEQLLWDRGGREFAIAVVTDPEGNYVLVEEPKYGQMRRMVSAPTGGVKKGESPLTAAEREFLEETGYEASNWRFAQLGPIADFADKVDGGWHYICVADNARKVKEPRNLEQKVLMLPVFEIEYVIRASKMPAMSMVALLLVLHNGHEE